MSSPSQQADLFRILDANANRASEGLRVVEDYVRFSLDDRFLAQRCKEMRHRLTALLLDLCPDHRTSARDTLHDVGTGNSTEREYHRNDPREVANANLKRIQQSLRCIEEFGKTLSADTAQKTEQLRYECYILEKAIAAARWGRQSLSQARLYVLVDGGKSTVDFEARVGALIDAGVHVLQLRDKRLGDRVLLQRARWLRKATGGTGTLFIMNDRPDLALLAHADGVHVGQEELTVKEARSVMGADKLVGVSTHSVQQARQAVLDGANYIGVGPVFTSETKSFKHLPGPPLLAEVTSEVSLPAFAIGGINMRNLGQILAAGGRRVAVSGTIWQAEDPARSAKQLLARLADAAETE